MARFNLTEHDCDACVITCMDFRIFTSHALYSFMTKENKTKYDLIAIPGAGKALIDESSREMILNAVKISLELHNAKVVYLIHHRDCGAYGGSKAAESPEAEFNMHWEEMKKAKDIIHKEIGSSVSVKMIFFDTVTDASNLSMHELKAIPVI